MRFTYSERRQGLMIAGGLLSGVIPETRLVISLCPRVITEAAGGGAAPAP